MLPEFPPRLREVISYGAIGFGLTFVFLAGTGFGWWVLLRAAQ